MRGTKKEAEVEAAKIVAGLSNGAHVESSKETVAQFAERWLRDWADVSAATAQRYEQLLRLHVSGRIGQMPIQKLTPSVLATLYRGLQRDGMGDKGLNARTVGHVHRVLHVMLQRAAQLGVIHGNPASLVKAPKVRAAEIETLSVRYCAACGKIPSTPLPP